MNNRKIKLISAKVIDNIHHKNKTLVVLIEREYYNQYYRKLVKQKSVRIVHYESAEFIENGQYVFIKECKPISKVKRYIVHGENK